MIAQFLAGVEKGAFLENVEKQSAVIHQLLVVGEASKRLTEPFRQHHGDIPWRQIGGMRDRIIHGYDRVDLDIVWFAATVHVPALLTYLSPLLPPPPPRE